MQSYKIQCKAMDTDIEIEGSGFIDHTDWHKDIEDWFKQFEQICSRFDSESELSILNRKPQNTVVSVHPILYDILRKAMIYAEKTNFQFNPFIGTAIKSQGYDATFSKIKRKTIIRNERHELDVSMNEPIVFFPVLYGIIKKVKDEIDLGGIAKGWSVDKVVSMLSELGITSGIVNAGGDLFVWGDQERTIGISRPEIEHSDKDIIQFTMRNGAVATSNKLYRSWCVNEEKVHHILDGKTGMSAQSDIVQATVFSINTTEADVLAKLVCMHTFEDAIPWLSDHFPQTGCIIINDNGQVAISKSVGNYITRLVM